MIYIVVIDLKGSQDKGTITCHPGEIRVSAPQLIMFLLDVPWSDMDTYYRSPCPVCNKWGKVVNFGQETENAPGL